MDGPAAENWFEDVLARFADGNGAELSAARLDSPAGPLFAVADEDNLLLLEFSGQKNPDRLARLLPAGTVLSERLNAPLKEAAAQLEGYFGGERRSFTVPLRTSGTPFQEAVWEQLLRIPYGEVIPYAELALRTGSPKAFRAAAQANAVNRISIIIPCHRVVNSGGTIGGYGGGVPRKRWLLGHEGATLG